MWPGELKRSSLDEEICNDAIQGHETELETLSRQIKQPEQEEGDAFPGAIQEQQQLDFSTNRSFTPNFVFMQQYAQEPLLPFYDYFALEASSLNSHSSPDDARGINQSSFVPGALGREPIRMYPEQIIDGSTGASPPALSEPLSLATSQRPSYFSTTSLAADSRAQPTSLPPDHIQQLPQEQERMQHHFSQLAKSTAILSGGYLEYSQASRSSASCGAGLSNRQEQSAWAEQVSAQCPTGLRAIQRPLQSGIYPQHTAALSNSGEVGAVKSKASEGFSPPASFLPELNIQHQEASIPHVFPPSYSLNPPSILPHQQSPQSAQQNWSCQQSIADEENREKNQLVQQQNLHHHGRQQQQQQQNDWWQQQWPLFHPMDMIMTPIRPQQQQQQRAQQIAPIHADGVLPFFRPATGIQGMHQTHLAAAAPPPLSRNLPPPSKPGPPMLERHRKKDKDRPKRPLTAYNIFFQRERARLLGESPPAILDVTSCDREGNDAASGIVTPAAYSATVAATEETGKFSAQEKVQNERKNLKSRAKRASHGKITFEEMAREISKRWKSVDEGYRAQIQRLVDLDKIRYQKEKAAYLERKRKRDEERQCEQQQYASMLKNTIVSERKKDAK